MKRFRKEFGADYPNYRFGYCEYAAQEKGDAPENFYENGFLPYSADPETAGTFYMARSARLLLPQFSFTSENRRIAKRFDGSFTRRALTPAEVEADPRIRTLFLSYFNHRHGNSVMPPERFDALLSWLLPLRILAYEKDGTLSAAVLEVRGPAFGHFWFSAYDLSYVEQSLGMWLMLDAAKLAKEDGLVRYYLGTVYGEKALYKTNLEPLQYWNGSGWSSDVAQLKILARAEKGGYLPQEVVATVSS